MTDTLGAWRHLVELAAARLRSAGWTVEATQHEQAHAWHVASRRGDKWRVVQLLGPATAAPFRQARRRELAETVRLAPRRGTMEQWGAHVRPGGRVVFGEETLNGTAWVGLPDEGELVERLGLTAPGTDAHTTAH